MTEKEMELINKCTQLKALIYDLVEKANELCISIHLCSGCAQHHSLYHSGRHQALETAIKNVCLNK